MMDNLSACVFCGFPSVADNHTCRAEVLVWKERCQRLTEELVVSDLLLKDRTRLLDAIPECKAHGRCVPHAIEWVAEAIMRS